jgi:hypothetical protein
VSSLMDIYQRLCTDDRFPSADVTDPTRRHQRQQNLKTSIRYLAAAYDSTPDRLDVTAVDGTYKDRLRTHLTAQGKGHSTVRNTIQDIGQFLRAHLDLPKAVPVMPPARKFPSWRATHAALAKASPYAHYTWVKGSGYWLQRQDWPEDIESRFKTFEDRRRVQVRPVTIENNQRMLEGYLGYLGMTPKARLEALPSEARAKLALKPYRHDLNAITATPQTHAWNDLFVLNYLESFVTWHAWRIHTARDAQVRERPPSKPSTMGRMVVETVRRLAHTLDRKRDFTAISAYFRRLPEPRKIHNKSAPYHQFTCAELEEVALTLISEARAMPLWEISQHNSYPGTRPAQRFALGLVLMLGWRIPIRRRNWVEALIDTHLIKDNGVWHWRFEGDDLKVGMRNGETNIFDVEIPAEVTPYLQEYIDVWRPKFRYAATDRHVLLSQHPRGHGTITGRALSTKLLHHVYRLTGKRLSMHLLRTLFVSHAIKSGMDVNSVAFIMNDRVATILPFYNEFYAQEHQKAAQDFYRRALTPGNGNGSRG